MITVSDSNLVIGWSFAVWQAPSNVYLSVFGGNMGVRGDRYLTIQEWMITELGLKGNELLVYAIIWGFTQDGVQIFEQSQAYMAEWLGSDRRSIIRSMQALVSKGLIKKIGISKNGAIACRAVHPSCDKMSHPQDENDDPLSVLRQNVTCDKMSQEENEGKENEERKEKEKESCIKKKNKEKEEEEKRKEEKNLSFKISQLEAEFEIVWSQYPRRQGKTGALKAYMKARKQGVSQKTIEDGIQAYKQAIKALSTEQCYVKIGSTWFNQKCWEDDYTVHSQPNTSNPYANAIRHLEEMERKGELDEYYRSL